MHIYISKDINYKFKKLWERKFPTERKTRENDEMPANTRNDTCLDKKIAKKYS